MDKIRSFSSFINTPDFFIYDLSVVEIFHRSRLSISWIDLPTILHRSSLSHLYEIIVMLLLFLYMFISYMSSILNSEIPKN